MLSATLFCGQIRGGASFLVSVEPFVKQCQKRGVFMTTISGEKLLSEAIRDRRATPSFENVPIHTADLEKIVRAGLEAPSGYNLQPWRFVVVRDPEQRKRLRAAAFGQPKVEEAPVVLVACGDPEAWRGENGDVEKMIGLVKERGLINE